jgi:gas vesicle protein
MSLGKIVLGTLAGVATGVLLGVLFAPEKGTDLRSKIGKKSKGYSDSVKGKLNEILDSVKHKFDTEKVHAQ